MNQTLNVAERLCGQRVAGGAYAECRLSEEGVPLHEFLIDPPILLDCQALGLAAVGVKLIESEGVWHVFDIVGQEHYPYPADFVEESLRQGASRRLAGNLDFTRLTLQSRLVLIHPRAGILNYEDYPWPASYPCPKGLAQHMGEELPEMCAGLWWQDLPGLSDAFGRVERRLAGGARYRGYARPKGITPQYHGAIFMVLPITNLAVIRGGESSQDNFEAACLSQLPVFFADR